MISVIIVTYNSSVEITECIGSLTEAVKQYHYEIIVVDNNSSDNTCEVIESSFPGIKLYRNNRNRGFASGANRGAAEASGEYLLFLNPDTRVPENCIDEPMRYLSRNSRTGIIGPRLVDSRGKFLPESKRGVPTPAAALFRFTMLYRLFPHSPVINRYYMGGSDSSKTVLADAVTGAFMFMERAIFEDAGGFDEEYFMYGEDIDLCMRVSAMGYDIVYLPSVTVTHHKGKSGGMRSYRGIREFYRSMHIFTNNHFSSRYSRITILLTHLAIRILFILSLIKRVPLLAKRDLGQRSRTGHHKA